MGLQMGQSFIYDGVPSERYNVSLVFLKDSYTNRPSGSDKKFITEDVFRNAKKRFLDVKQEDALSFNVEIVFDEPVDIYTLTKVKDWLSSGIGYKPLQICAENFTSYYYNCLIHLDEDLIYAGGYRGVSATIECDAPWAWQFTETKTYNLKTDGVTKFTFNNISQDIEMLKPVLKFHMKKAGKFSINCKFYDDVYFMIFDNEIIKNNISYQDAVRYCIQHHISKDKIKPALRYDKTTEFTNLLQDDIVSCDAQYGIIKSKLTPNIVQNFNKNFLKFPKGVCYLTVTGQADMMEIEYQNAKKIGGGYY